MGVRRLRRGRRDQWLLGLFHFLLLTHGVSLDEAKLTEEAFLTLSARGGPNKAVPWQGLAMVSTQVRHDGTGVPELVWLGFVAWYLRRVCVYMRCFVMANRRLLGLPRWGNHIDGHGGCARTVS